MRRVRWLAIALVAAAALVACGDDDDGASDTTNAPDSTEDETTTTNGSTTSGDGGDGGEVTDAPDDDIDPWQRTAVDLRGDDGRLIRYDCPPPGQPDTAWGTDLYTDDSSVCTAAVHAGVIDLDEGGDVVIAIRPGADEYEGSEQNGITTLDYGAWGGSFEVVDD